MYNIIIVNSHDTGDFISPYGYKLPTPRLEEFCYDATLFENSFCASPTCSPSRAALMTGQFNTTNGMIGLSHRGFELTDLKSHLPNILKENNYHTVLCGIQHEHGNLAVFDDEHVNISKDIGYIENISTNIRGLESDEDQLIWDNNNAMAVVDYISNYKKDKPLFLQLGMFAAHRSYPTNIEKEYKYMSKPHQFRNFEEDDTQGLYKSLETLDTNFGLVYDALKDNDMLDNTIIVYTTDHGLANPEYKCFLTDGGIKVAFLMKHPDIKISNYKNQFNNVDFVPTLLDSLEIKYDKANIHGVSHYESLKNNTALENDIYSMVNVHISLDPQRSIRTKRYKLIKYYDYVYLGPNYANIDKSLYKDEYLKLNKPKEYIQLYDLFFDPDENNNLASKQEYQHLVKMLDEKLENKFNEVNDYIPTVEEVLNNGGKLCKSSAVIPFTGDADNFH